MPPPVRLSLLLVALLAAGCAERDAASANGSTIADDLGRSVPVAPPVARVLTLAPNLTEILFAVDAGDALVGASQADNFPAEVAALPCFGTYPLDLEAVVALRPDLVLATDQVNNPDDARPLAEAGVPTYFFSFDALDDVPRAMRRVGELVGTQARADAAADSFEMRLQRLAARTDTLDRPRTLLLIGDETLFAFGSASYTQQMIALAGGESVTAGFDGEAVTVSDEFVLEAAPVVIVGTFGADTDAARLLALHPAWASVPAVAAGRVHSIDPDLVLRPGPRLADGAETLARLLHPDAFADLAPPDGVAQ